MIARLLTGYELVCVSAVDQRFQKARLQNLHNCGFPITWMIATRGATEAVGAKAVALQQLRPFAFVDDFLLYLRGLGNDIHAALVLWEPGSMPSRSTIVCTHAI